MAAFIMDINFPGEKLLIKIIDTLEKGVGTLGRPWQITRDGKARAEMLRLEKLAIAQAEVEAEEIRQGRKGLVNGELLALPAPSGTGEPDDGTDKMITFLSAAKAGADYLVVKRAINLRKIVVIAETEAKETPDEEVSNDPIDPDWFARWREAAQDVSNEEMQQLWARLLKDEVKTPGTFSLQTISLLRNLSFQQAHWIATLAPFTIDSWIFKKCDDLMAKKGLTLDVLLELESLGVLTGLDAIGGINRKINFEPEPGNESMSVALAATHGEGVLIRHKTPPPELAIPIYGVLNVGQEIIALGQFEPSREGLEMLGRFCMEKGFEAFLVDTAPAQGNRMRISNRRPIK